MLNAFRHHGQGDSSATDSQCCLMLCSTPFGITARGTGIGLVGAERLEVVLNAFRHHGQGDLADTSSGALVSVLNAFRHHGQGDD